MNRFQPLRFLLILLPAALLASSCSGPLKGGSGGGGTTAAVIVTVTSTPSQTFLFPSLNWAITSVDLIDSAGNAVIVVQGALPPVDFARLQSDSQFLGITLSNIPTGTYTSVKIQLAPSTATSYFYNSTSSTLLGCAPATVCKIPATVAGFGATTVTAPVTFTVSAANNGFSLNFDLSKAVTTTGGMTFDFTKSGAITLATLPRTGQTSGLDSLQNFTGTVTAKTSTTIDMSSASSNTRTFTVSPTAEFDDPFTVCTGAANFSCLAVNQNISVDAIVNSDGTLTAYEVDFLDPGPSVVQETEGVIVSPLLNNQFTMVVTNAMPATGFLPGALATVTLNSATTNLYFADPKNLEVSSTPQGFTNSSDLVVGQTVMLRGGSITTNTLTNYTRTLLRYSSIGGTVQTVGSPSFTLSGLSPFFASSTTNTVQVQTFANTTYDNITGLSGLTVGTNASVRGLYLNPNIGVAQPLLAARVRTH